MSPIPTPAGYLLSLSEPDVSHEPEHRGCHADWNVFVTVPREWTRDQLTTVRNWLPTDAVRARSKLTELIDSLEWRQYLAGWFCYASAGIAGLVFTRWGAIAMVEPWRRRQAWGESVFLMVKIVLAACGLLFLFKVLFD